MVWWLHWWLCTSHSRFSAELSLSLLRDRGLCIPFGFSTAMGRLPKCNFAISVSIHCCYRELSKEVLFFCLFCGVFFTPASVAWHIQCVWCFLLGTFPLVRKCRGEQLYELRDFYFKSLWLVLWVIQMVHPLIVWVIDDDKWVDQRHCKLLTLRQNHYLKTIVLAVFGYQSIWLRNELELQHWEKEISPWHAE